MIDRTGAHMKDCESHCVMYCETQYNTIHFNITSRIISYVHITTFNAFNTPNTIYTPSHPSPSIMLTCWPLPTPLFLWYLSCNYCHTLRSHIIHNSRTLLFLPLSTDTFRHFHLHFCFATITWSAYMIILQQIAGNN